MSCFPLGQMRGLTFTQYRKYTTAVSTYRRVEAYNANISTLRGNGDKGQTYYIYRSNDEETTYTLGLYLLTQNDPANTYTPVQKN
jgi:hypothetical protein